VTTSKVSDLTIDELAQTAGVVVSTVRLYQNRGLLPPPVKRGRVGYYGAAHLGRLRLIGELQDRGFSLAGIKALLDGMDRGQSLQAVLGIAGGGGAGDDGASDGGGPSTWVREQAVTMTVAELAVHLPGMEFDAGLVRRTIALGLLEFSADGTEVVVHSPSFLRIGSELAALGLPPNVILDEYEALATETAEIAARFTEVFRVHLWEPFVNRGLPAAEVARLVGALEKLGPLAEGVVGMSLRHALQEAAERFIEAEATRLGVAIPRPGPA
jgi:DNA-binding transcriptional MerR regulator